MICGIYRIKNLINEKSYVGQSTNIEKRWNKEKTSAFNKNYASYDYPLSRAFRKYGIENFSFEVIEECSKEELDEKEQYYIDKFDSIFNGYNQVNATQGGAILTPQLVLDIIEELKVNETDSTDSIGKKFGVSGRTIRSINSGESWHMSNCIYPIRQPYTYKEKTKKYCKICGKEIQTKEAKYCIDCGHQIQRRTERPSREELKQLIRTTSFLSIGKQFGVSDNAIRKWCDSYNLPRKATEIKKYTDKEWEQI